MFNQNKVIKVSDEYIQVLARRDQKGEFGPENCFWREPRTSFERKTGIEEWHPNEPLSLPLSKFEQKEKKKFSGEKLPMFDIWHRMRWRTSSRSDEWVKQNIRSNIDWPDETRALAKLNNKKKKHKKKVFRWNELSELCEQLRETVFPRFDILYKLTELRHRSESREQESIDIRAMLEIQDINREMEELGLRDPAAETAIIDTNRGEVELSYPFNNEGLVRDYQKVLSFDRGWQEQLDETFGFNHLGKSK